MSGKVWFITGASRGFGRVWTEAALERGDRVAATARDVAALDGLAAHYGNAVLALPLDVAERASVGKAVSAAHERFGRLDVVVNNAGYGLFGAVEDVTEEQARAQFETNFFGALWVTQAVLPILREQHSGHLVQLSSIGGIASWPMFGLYHATKWAIEGMSDALAQEVARFGIHVTILEPGPYRTDWRGSSAVWADPSPAYAEWAKAPGIGSPPGDPAATAAPMMELVDAEQPPLRAFFGSSALEMTRAVYEDRLRVWEQWDAVAKEAQGS